MGRNVAARRMARGHGQHTIPRGRDQQSWRRRSNRPGNSQAKGPRRVWTSGKQGRRWGGPHRRGNPARRRGNLSGPM